MSCASAATSWWVVSDGARVRGGVFVRASEADRPHRQQDWDCLSPCSSCLQALEKIDVVSNKLSGVVDERMYYREASA
jgi:hypothetical protein